MLKTQIECNIFFSFVFNIFALGIFELRSYYMYISFICLLFLQSCYSINENDHNIILGIKLES